MRGPSHITDIHTHVLPGVDDGPVTARDTDALMRAHLEAGTDRIFCTSHFLSPHFDTNPDEILAAYGELSTDPSDPWPAFTRGAEVRVGDPLANHLRSAELPGLGDTGYVLLEFPNSHLDDKLLAFVHEVKVRGFQPIMAHPERNIAVQKDPDWIDRLLELGLILQCTAQCFEKDPGSKLHMGDKVAWHILERGALGLIASDAHDVAYRPPGLLAAYEGIEQKYGEDVVQQLIDNANAVWAGDSVNPVSVPKRRRGWFSRSR